MALVSCSSCDNFLRDLIGFGQGIGKCKPFEDYKALNPSKVAISKALRSLGNNPDYDGDLFWGGDVIDRRCEKYKEKMQ